MKSEDIKKECEENFNKIKEANDRLAELRKICKHTNRFIGNYSWRPGAIEEAMICSDCGELIKYLNF
jgi:predicted TIM-barrel fold metal-dependent hydrolase